MEPEFFRALLWNFPIGKQYDNCDVIKAFIINLRFGESLYLKIPDSACARLLTKLTDVIIKTQSIIKIYS